MQKIKIVIFLVILLTVIITGCCISGCLDRLGTSGTPTITPMDTTNVTLRVGGNPCTSDEEWHEKADEIGFWGDGLLVRENVSDDEVFELLRSNGVPEFIDFDRHSPGDERWRGYVGYYIAANESDYWEIRETVEADMYRWRMRFYSHNIGFISPFVKKQGERILSPVFLLSGGNWSREQIYQDLLIRGVPVKRADIVDIDLSDAFTPAERERILYDLNADYRVLFAYKEYMSGDIC